MPFGAHAGCIKGICTVMTEGQQHEENNARAAILSAAVAG